MRRIRRTRGSFLSLPFFFLIAIVPIVFTRQEQPHTLHLTHVAHELTHTRPRIQIPKPNGPIIRCREEHLSRVDLVTGIMTRRPRAGRLEESWTFRGCPLIRRRGIRIPKLHRINPIRMAPQRKRTPSPKIPNVDGRINTPTRQHVLVVIQTHHALGVAGEGSNAFASSPIPDFQCAVHAARDQFGFVELQCTNRERVTSETVQLGSGFHIPDADGAVVRPTDEDWERRM